MAEFNNSQTVPRQTALHTTHQTLVQNYKEGGKARSEETHWCMQSDRFRYLAHGDTPVRVQYDSNRFNSMPADHDLVVKRLSLHVTPHMAHNKLNAIPNIVPHLFKMVQHRNLGR